MNFLLVINFLLTHPIDFQGNFIGDKDIISIDLTDAGIGDNVIVVHEGDAVQQILGMIKLR